MYEKSYPKKRFKHTIEFLKKHVSPSETILDLGVVNPFTQIMQEHGYSVENTKGEDLDEDITNIKKYKVKKTSCEYSFKTLVLFRIST